jgi:hypothetical protein
MQLLILLHGSSFRRQGLGDGPRPRLPALLLLLLLLLLVLPLSSPPACLHANNALAACERATTVALQHSDATWS